MSPAPLTFHKKRHGMVGEGWRFWLIKMLNFSTPVCTCEMWKSERRDAGLDGGTPPHITSRLSDFKKPPVAIRANFLGGYYLKRHLNIL